MLFFANRCKIDRYWIDSRCLFKKNICYALCDVYQHKFLKNQRPSWGYPKYSFRSLWSVYKKIKGWLSFNEYNLGSNKSQPLCNNKNCKTNLWVYLNFDPRLELNLKAVIIDSDGLYQPSYQSIIVLLNLSALPGEEWFRYCHFKFVFLRNTICVTSICYLQPCFYLPKSKTVFSTMLYLPHLICSYIQHKSGFIVVFKKASHLAKPLISRAFRRYLFFPWQ